MEKLKLIDTQDPKSESPYAKIQQRKTQEQIIALCGPVGSGTKDISEIIGRHFKSHSYEVKAIRASDLIVEAITELIDGGTIDKEKYVLSDWPSEGDRISALQDMGDFLRKKFGSDIVAQLFIKKVSTNRQSEITIAESEKGLLRKESRPIVWILNSLKHPEEVRLLRLVYDKMFSLFGVLCSFEIKKHILTKRHKLDPTEAEILIKRDESEDISHGQKLIKTLQYGDFFIRNTPYEAARVVQSIDRCVKIILGDHSITPTHGEYAMFLAQSSAYRSGCMSRQVGAAIVNDRGEIISTGFNDVPKFGGGLYLENPIKDARCFKVAGEECENDSNKKKIKNVILQTIRDTGLDKGIDLAFVEKICKKSGINDLTEYCRAVHAEMDAITSAARKGTSLRESTIYVTTFPCHNCAKHIISSGIKRVFYIEPYEKSLAIALHNDSVSTSTSGAADPDAVEFLAFEGVAPRQYQNRFCTTVAKKSNGKYVRIDLGEETPAYAQLMDCFAEYESKIVDCLAESGL